MSCPVLSSFWCFTKCSLPLEPQCKLINCNLCLSWVILLKVIILLPDTDYLIWGRVERLLSIKINAKCWWCKMRWTNKLKVNLFQKDEVLKCQECILAFLEYVVSKRVCVRVHAHCGHSYSTCMCVWVLMLILSSWWMGFIISNLFSLSDELSFLSEQLCLWW